MGHELAPCDCPVGASRAAAQRSRRDRGERSDAWLGAHPGRLSQLKRDWCGAIEAQSRARDAGLDWLGDNLSPSPSQGAQSTEPARPEQRNDSPATAASSTNRLMSMLSFRRCSCVMPCLGTELLSASAGIHIRAGDDIARATKGGESNMPRIRPLVATLAATGLLAGGGAAIASAATSTSSAASSTATTAPAKTMPTGPPAGAKAPPAGAKGSRNCPNM
jgi:hypothetical protein